MPKKKPPSYTEIDPWELTSIQCARYALKGCSAAVQYMADVDVLPDQIQQQLRDQYGPHRLVWLGRATNKMSRWGIAKE